MVWVFLLLSCLAFGEESMLGLADFVSEKFSGEIAKTPPPPTHPKVDQALDYSVWLTLDLAHIANKEEETVFSQIASPVFLDILSRIGVETLYLEGVKDPFFFFANPSWGDYAPFYEETKRWGLALAGDTLKSSAPWGPDFEMALQNAGEYPGLFHLVEIAQEDWKYLPKVPVGEIGANIPWLTLQKLHALGYVPEKSDPYVKKSAWNATKKITCLDGKFRRWIYLQEEGRPLFSWLSPTFGASRIAAGSILDSIYELKQKIVTLDASLPLFTKETLSLWTRKIGGFSAEKIDRGLFSLKNMKADLAFDTLTRPALLHALIAEDAEALRLIYKIFLDEGIEIKRLIHMLEPFDEFACSWSELLFYSKQKYPYWQETVTGEILRKRLLKEDLYRLNMTGEEKIAPSTWIDYCRKALGIKEAEKEAEKIQKAHLLLAVAYAMQPGAFAFSLSDLVGALPEEATSIDLLGANPKALYPSLPVQAKSPSSFTSQLAKMLEVRKKWSLAKGKVLEVSPVRNKSSLILLQELHTSGMVAALALNFGRGEVKETICHPALRSTDAIELLSHLTAEKEFDAPSFSFSLSPLSGKVFLFQKKYYD